MPLPPHYQVTLRYRREGSTASCILYYVSPGAEPTPESMVAVADAVHAAVSPECRAVINPGTMFEGVDVRYLTADLLLEASSTEDAAAGTGPAGDCLPEEDAVVIQRRTGLPGRSRRGRIFVPFVPEVFAVDSQLTPAALTAYREMGQVITSEIGQVEGANPILQPRQPTWKFNLLLPIIASRVLDNTCSRRDRRNPKRPRAIGGAGNAG